MKKNKKNKLFLFFLFFAQLANAPLMAAKDKRFERFQIGGGGTIDPLTAMYIILSIAVSGLVLYYLYQYYINYLKPNSATELFKEDDLYQLLQKTHQLTFKERFAMYRLCRNKKITHPSILFLRPTLFSKYILEFESENRPETRYLRTMQEKIHKGKYPRPLVLPSSQI